MRLDLHNHTIPVFPKAWMLSHSNQPNFKDIYQIIKYHQLDGLAITNTHNLNMAIELAHEYPEYIIVGAEYQVIVGENTSFQVVVLDVDQDLHTQLLHAKARGVSYFTSILNEKNVPYFLAHICWGIPNCSLESVKLIDHWISSFYAIEVADLYVRGMKLPFALAKYYDLAMIGGSNHLWSETGQRVYTHVDAKNLDEFYSGIRNRKSKIGITDPVRKISKELPFMRQLRNNTYFQEIKKIWHSELGEDTLKSLAKSLFLSTIEWLPQSYYSQQRKSYMKKADKMHHLFMEYLIGKESQKIFRLDLEIEKKQDLLQSALGKIYESFQMGLEL